MTTTTDVDVICKTDNTNGRQQAASPDHELARTVPSIEARLRHRFPTVPAELVRACIDDAVLATAGATVRNFLPILVERQASDALRDFVQPEHPGSRLHNGGIVGFRSRVDSGGDELTTNGQY